MAGFAERFLHVDMDAFFVEVERQRNPALVGVPVIVGGLGARGVVASASYEARSRGVHSAMPMVEARRLCPQGRYLPPDHGRYEEVSVQVFELLRTFTPLVEGLSVDEAFLDIAGLRLHYPDPAAAGDELRRLIRTRLGLPASVGIAAVKFISKLASDAAKPDGLVVVPAGGEVDFLHPMPVQRLWGVGEATRATLEALGVATVGDLAAVPEEMLSSRLGPSLAQHLHRLARGIDPRGVDGGDAAKSISAEETFDVDITGEAEVDRALLRLCDRLAGRMYRSGYVGHTVSLKIRFGNFETLTRSETLVDPVEHAPALREEAQKLLGRVELAGRGVRLLGVGVAGLVDAAAPRQLSLESRPQEVAAGVVEEVRKRFGHNAVIPASLMRRSGRQDRGE
jgi:DNA polymerase-4